MKKDWNREDLKKRYQEIALCALEEGCALEDIENPYVEKLCGQITNPHTRSKSRLAYFLGQLRAIFDIDEGYSGLSPDTPEGRIYQYSEYLSLKELKKVAEICSPIQQAKNRDIQALEEIAQYVEFAALDNLYR